MIGAAVAGSKPLLQRALAELSWLVEIGAGVLVFGLVQLLLFPGDPGLLGLAPHPLLGLAAVVAVRHGTPRGLLGGLVCAALHLGIQLLVGGGPAAAFAGGGSARLAFGPPILITLAGAVLGELARGRQLELDRARLRLRGTEARLREVGQTLGAVSDRYQALERRLLEPAAGVALLHRAAARLESLNEDELYPALLTILAEQLRIDACEVYVLERDQLRLAASHGDSQLPRERPKDEGLIGLALQEGRVVSARDAVERPELTLSRAETMIAAPLLGRRGQPLGVINVRRLPFARLTSAAERVVEMVADWGARALEKTRLIRELRTIDERTGALTREHLTQRLELELARARRFGNPLSLLAVTLADADALPVELVDRVARLSAQLLTASLRTIDLVASDGTRCGFRVALPGTDALGAEHVRAKLEAELTSLDLDAGRQRLRYELGCASVTKRTKTVAELVGAAEQHAKAIARLSAAGAS